MSFLNATIERFTDADRLPKSLSEWAVPAAAATAVLVAGTSYLLKSNGEKRPPHVPSYIPWVGSNWAIEADPDAFFDAAQKKYGPVFSVSHAGSTYTYVTSSALVSQIQRQPKLFHISVPQRSWSKNIWLSSDNVMHSMIHGGLRQIFHHGFLPNNIHPFVQAFDSQLRQDVETRALPSESVSLQDWMLRLAYRATGAAYFGPTFDVEGTYDDFKLFDDKVWKVALGYPPFLLRDFVNSRKRLIESFRKYLQGPKEPSDTIAMRLSACQDQELQETEVCTLMMGSWWPLMANVPLGSLWAMILQLQRPEGLKDLRAELEAAGAAWSAANPDFKGPYTNHFAEFFKSSPHVPLLSSTIAETLRFTSDSYSMRGVLVDTCELGGYTFHKDETVVCRTRAIHQNESEFPNAKEFIPTRFIAEDVGKSVETNYKWMPFGGGISMCSGRHFAAYHQRIMLATLITHFNFEIDHAKSTPVVQSPVNRGFGLRRPSGQLYVKITRI